MAWHNYKRVFQAIELFSQFETAAPKDTRLGSNELLILIRLAAHMADKDGFDGERIADTCFPEIPTIAKECFMVRSTVVKSLKRLIEGGYISKSKMPGTKVRGGKYKGAWEKNRYRLDPVLWGSVGNIGDPKVKTQLSQPSNQDREALTHARDPALDAAVLSMDLDFAPISIPKSPPLPTAPQPVKPAKPTDHICGILDLLKTTFSAHETVLHPDVDKMIMFGVRDIISALGEEKAVALLRWIILDDSQASIEIYNALCKSEKLGGYIKAHHREWQAAMDAEEAGVAEIASKPTPTPPTSEPAALPLSTPAPVVAPAPAKPALTSQLLETIDLLKTARRPTYGEVSHELIDTIFQGDLQTVITDIGEDETVDLLCFALLDNHDFAMSMRADIRSSNALGGLFAASYKWWEKKKNEAIYDECWGRLNAYCDLDSPEVGPTFAPGEEYKIRPVLAWFRRRVGSELLDHRLVVEGVEGEGRIAERRSTTLLMTISPAFRMHYQFHMRPAVDIDAKVLRSLGDMVPDAPSRFAREVWASQDQKHPRAAGVTNWSSILYGYQRTDTEALVYEYFRADKAGVEG